MSLSMEIRLIDAASQKSEICDKILRALPEWFGIEKAIRDYVSAVRDMEMLVAVVNQDVVGFLALKRHNPYTSEIYVLGVLENYHRMGIGRRLVEEAVEFLSRDGVKYLTVKTLSSSNHDPFYAKTRDFYQAMGFLPLEEFKTLWDEGNPMLDANQIDKQPPKEKIGQHFWISSLNEAILKVSEDKAKEPVKATQRLPGVGAVSARN